MNLQRSVNESARALGTISSAKRSVPSEASFHRMISIEKMRTQRSGKPILMMLVDIGHPSETSEKVHGNVLRSIELSTRETDLTGWYKDNSVVGVLLTEIAIDDRSSLLKQMFVRVSKTLREHLSSPEYNKVSISFQFFPENSERGISKQARKQVSLPVPFLPTAAEESAAL